jgi:hypothetical protein
MEGTMRYALAVWLLGCSQGICDAGELTDALDGAASGDVVQIAGGCVIAGAFTIPAGVTLEGGTIDGDDGSVAITMETADGRTTTLRGVHVIGASRAAIGIYGEGCAEIADVRIDVTHGLGIGGANIGCLRASGVVVRGDVTEESAAAFAMGPIQSSAGPTYGLAIVSAGEVDVRESSFTGFANGGIALREVSTAVLAGVDVSENRRAGVTVADSALEWTDGAARASWHDGFGAAALSIMGGSARTTGLTIEDGDGIGVLAFDADHEHDGLRITSLGAEGVWTEGGRAIFTRANIDHTTRAGIYAVDSDRVEVSGAIGAVELGSTPVGAGVVDVGDGLLLARRGLSAPPLDALLSGLELAENARVGVLIEGASGALDGVALVDVSVDAEGAQLGVVAQNVEEPRPEDWDREVTRTGAALANDVSFAGALEIVREIKMPPVIVGTDIDDFM